MSLPNSIQKLIQQIDHNLTQTEQRAYQGINLVRPLLEKFPENFILMRHFAYFNNVVLFIGIAQNKTRSIVDICTQENLTTEEIQEIGKDLGELLGRILDAKISIENIIKILEI